jgi:predicted negative regulator of RcsB-dependent stress response
MNKSILGTIIVVAAVGLAGYFVYQHYQTVQGTNTASIWGNIGKNLGISGNLNLNTLVGDLGGLFGGDDTGSA